MFWNNRRRCLIDHDGAGQAGNQSHVWRDMLELDADRNTLREIDDGKKTIPTVTISDGAADCPAAESLIERTRKAKKFLADKA
jgi:hypothetical protein